MKWPKSFWLAAAILFAAVVLQASTMNKDLFLGLNSWATVLPDVIWSCWTILGDTWMVLTLLALCLWWQPQALLGFALAVPLGGAVSRLTKVLTQMPRPAGAMEPNQFHIVGPVLEFHSFPSGHTLSAFALLAVVLAGRRWGMWGWAGRFLAHGRWRALACRCVGGRRFGLGVRNIHPGLGGSMAAAPKPRAARPHFACVGLGLPGVVCRGLPH